MGGVRGALTRMVMVVAGLSVFVVLAGLVTVVGAGVGEASAAAPASGTSAGLTELPKLRTRTSDTFSDGNGGMVTRVFSGPVNFRDGSGDLAPIDNALESSGGGEVSNAANAYRTLDPT